MSLDWVQYKGSDENFQKIIHKNNVSLTAIVGKNGSGKTKLIKETIDWLKSKEFICLYIKAEFNQKEVLNKTEEYLNELAKKDPDKLDDFLNKFKKQLPKNDENFHNFFSECLDFKENKIIIKKLDDKKIKIPSGIFLYSFLCLITAIIKVIKPKTGIKKFIIIDEIEKYAHISLINKISKLIGDLLKKDVNIIFSTHSPYQLEQIWNNYKNLSDDWLKNNKNNISKKSRKYKMNILVLKNNNIHKPEIFYKLFDHNFLIDKLLKMNYREISIIFKIFYVDKLFLVEGIKDRQLIDTIMNKYNNDCYYDISDCQGKSIIKKIFKIINEFGIIEPFVLFDLDDKDIKSFDEEIAKYKYQFSFKTNIEKALNLQKQEDKSDCSEINCDSIDKLRQQSKELQELIKKIKIFLTLKDDIKTTNNTNNKESEKQNKIQPKATKQKPKPKQEVKTNNQKNNQPKATKPKQEVKTNNQKNNQTKATKQKPKPKQEIKTNNQNNNQPKATKQKPKPKQEVKTNNQKNNKPKNKGTKNGTKASSK